MEFNYFRNNPPEPVIEILKSRRSLWREGRQKYHIQDAMRNNAWCKVTIDGITLPGNNTTFRSLYGSGKPKPPPSLESVTLRVAGEFGHALHADVTFICYSRADFELFDKHWMRPRQEGKISFGYVNPYNKSEQTYQDLTGFYVCLFEFNTDSSGHYICQIKLVGPSRFLEHVECKGGLKDFGILKYRTQSVLGLTSIHHVTSIEELLLYDAQINGTSSIDLLPDNYLIESPYGPILVYHPPDKGGSTGAFQRTVGRAMAMLSKSGDKQYTYNSEYYSLQYICDRIINDQLLGFLKLVSSEQCNDIIDKVKIICNSEVSIGVGYPEVRSANPLAMLILGNEKGNYKSNNGSGKNFETDGEGGGSKIKCHNDTTIDFSKIMIERMVICQAIESAREKTEISDKSTQTKTTDRTDNLIYINKFLEEIFLMIANETGGLYQLILIENPKNKHELLVVDKNRGTAGELKVFVFDPIDGDGSTREMSLNSNAGSRDYMGAMFDSITKQSDIISSVVDTMNEVDAKRAEELAKCIEEIHLKCTKSLPESNFGIDEIGGLRTALVTYNQLQSSDSNKYNQVVLYPGMNMKITLDGIWGFRIGNHIHTTLCPAYPYRDKDIGICFNVQHVTHTIRDNDWETELQGPMTFAKPVKYIY